MIRSIMCLWASLILISSTLFAEDGYRLWLRYDEINDIAVKEYYQDKIRAVHLDGESPILLTAKKELKKGLTGLMGKTISFNSNIVFANSLVAGVIGESKVLDELLPVKYIERVHSEGFLILDIGDHILLAAKDDKGVLYGAFDLLRRIQTHQSLDGIEEVQNPKVQLRVLNHWDNLDRTVERGYAGFSIWNWHELPKFIDRRYTEYARASASIGINGAVVTNVNANALIFRKDYMEKAAALADVLRPYGIKLYLTARFSAPIEQGGLATADPLVPEVQKWWDKKVEEIYSVIPDFGGFLVKANSEGQPGPQQYGRNHADGANMLASALEPFGGIVMWRAFVYSSEEPIDRAKQAYNEFMPLDGKFKKNVLVQVKNGPIDFQPREPIHPLFGAMEKTSVMMEFQITKEYLGQGTHMVGLANMYEEILNTDTYAKGKGSLVAKVVDGSLHGNQLTGIAGVANIGTARNWTGNLFGQADWYAYGRLAWDPYLSSDEIFDEWVKMTFTHDDKGLRTIKGMLKSSYETLVSSRTPLGLHHIMAAGHHYGPGPWVDKMSRADWTSVYYHKADDQGIGFDRTKTGSDALSQYSEAFRNEYSDMDNCPLEFLLWFHHVPWEHELKTGRTLWEELCRKYHTGAQEVSQLRQDWSSVREFIDDERFEHVDMHLSIQEEESIWWRDACLSYFQTFSKLEIPSDLEQPKYDVEHYKTIIYPYSPGIRPRW